MRYRKTCKHCGADCGDPQFDTCGHCACLKIGCWVTSPDGPGEIVQVRHSGGFIVQRGDGITRQYRGSDLAIQEEEPGRMPGQDDEPAPIAAAVPVPVPAAVPAVPAVGTWTDRRGEMFAELAADRTTDCPPLRDPDPLAAIRRALLSRDFGPAAFAQARP